MKSRIRIAPILLFAAALAAVPGYSQDAFRLKPGARGKVCMECHETFAPVLKLPSVHTPVKAGQCSDCHNPHAADHGKLLAGDPTGICQGCHDDMAPADATSVHGVVAAGECVRCHDPHGSQYANNLRLAGGELCAQCHPSVVSSAQSAKYKHGPVQGDCLTCHEAHASAGSPFLLKRPVPELCAGCHKTDQPGFVSRHMGYPVADSDCSSCHDPHGSNNRGILWETVHAPVVNKMCKQCHEEASSPNPLATRRQGLELCRGCHTTMLNETFARSRIHWPVVDRSACSNCHNPHASPHKALLAETTKTLCASCHEDTILRIEKAAFQHEPVASAACESCHAPHASNTVFLLQGKDVVEVCGGCHEWQEHSSHPIGAKALDPRNQNLSLDCLSCHDAHGSAFKAYAWLDTAADLCVGCHQNVRR